jgi:preprotein translocase subunit SecG
MGFVIGLLTVVMVLDCFILTLLVLIQLPKKEAGVGVAFGGAATDALFGAGSGNVLTKTTKYAAVAFFVLAAVLSLLQSHVYHRAGSEFRREVEQHSQLPATAPVPTAPAPSTATSSAPASLAVSTNLLIPVPTVEKAAPATTNSAPPPQK